MRKTPISSFVRSKKQTSVLCCVATALLLGGCQGIQSTLDARGPHAQSIATISWAMFWGASFILLLVMTLALYAIYRAPDKRMTPGINTLVLGGGVLLPVVTLTALIVWGVHTMGDVRPQADEVPPRIQVTANRWWWDVHYLDANGHIFTTANELRIPAGETVTVLLRSEDVIHSFWVPNLAGKMDVVPGRTNHIVLHADQPGTFRGQCAEFCGAQHARMAFHVIAEEPKAYEAWVEQQRAPARTSTDATAVRGRELFIQHCASCHTVRGVAQATSRGPDLTHLASRQYLGAGTLPNNHDNLIAFTARSQTIKPGNAMPSQEHLGEETLQAIASYLESLE